MLNKMERAYIEPFIADDFDFIGAYAFINKENNRVFLLSPFGTSMIINCGLYESLINKSLDSSFKRKLYSRGFTRDFRRPNVRCRAPKPEFIMIDITTKCNMNCFYCLRHFVNSGNNIDMGILKEILDYIIDYYNEVKIPLTIQPWGGEPLVAYDRILFIDDYLKEHGVKFSITIQTNGILLTDEIASELYKRNIGVGVSIDGCKEIHDLHRKDIGYKPTFDRVVKGIETLKKYYGDQFGTISVISSNTLPYLEKSIDSLAKDNNVRSFKLNFLHPNTDLFDMKYVVKDSELEGFWRRVINKNIELIDEGYDLYEANSMDKLLNLLNSSSGDICHSNGCTGGYSMISFSQDGDIFPCEMIGNEDFRLGNIKDDISLTDLISRNLPTNKYFVEKKCDECITCPWWVYCHGGCTATARFYGKGIGEIDSKECESNKVLYPLLIEKILEDLDNIKRITAYKLDYYKEG